MAIYKRNKSLKVKDGLYVSLNQIVSIDFNAGYERGGEIPAVRIELAGGQAYILPKEIINELQEKLSPKVLLRNRVLTLPLWINSGTSDLESLGKMVKKEKEMKSVTSRIDTIIKASDVVYYAIRAWCNCLMEEDIFWGKIDSLSEKLEMDTETLLGCCLKKYTLRATPGNTKDHYKEREAVASFLREKGVTL